MNLTPIEEKIIRLFFTNILSVQKVPDFLRYITASFFENLNLDPATTDIEGFFEGQEGRNCVYIQQYSSKKNLSNNDDLKENQLFMTIYAQDMAPLSGSAGKAHIVVELVNDSEVKVVLSDVPMVMMS